MSGYTEEHKTLNAEHGKLADDMWTAITEKLPFDTWIPFVQNHEVAVRLIKMFIDFDCYGENFTLSFNPEFSSFIKRSKEFKAYKVVKKGEKDAIKCGSECSLKNRDYGFGDSADLIQPFDKASK